MNGIKTYLDMIEDLTYIVNKLTDRIILLEKRLDQLVENSDVLADGADEVHAHEMRYHIERNGVK